MPAEPTPMRITHIRLRPHITVAPGTNLDKLPRLVAIAHHECFIANSLTSEMDVAATFAVAEQ
jgi:organic hydroperoxide reductase OsmC/OhrA